MYYYTTIIIIYYIIFVLSYSKMCLTCARKRFPIKKKLILSTHNKNSNHINRK